MYMLNSVCYRTLPCGTSVLNWQCDYFFSSESSVGCVFFYVV